MGKTLPQSGTGNKWDMGQRREAELNAGSKLLGYANRPAARPQCLEFESYAGKENVVEDFDGEVKQKALTLK